MTETNEIFFTIGFSKGDPAWRFSAFLDESELSMILKIIKVIRDPTYETIGEKLKQ